MISLENGYCILGIFLLLLCFRSQEGGNRSFTLFTQIAVLTTFVTNVELPTAQGIAGENTSPGKKKRKVHKKGKEEKVIRWRPQVCFKSLDSYFYQMKTGAGINVHCSRLSSFIKTSICVGNSETPYMYVYKREI